MGKLANKANGNVVSINSTNNEGIIRVQNTLDVLEKLIVENHTKGHSSLISVRDEIRKSLAETNERISNLESTIKSLFAHVCEIEASIKKGFDRPEINKVVKNEKAVDNVTGQQGQTADNQKSNGNTSSDKATAKPGTSQTVSKINESDGDISQKVFDAISIKSGNGLQLLKDFFASYNKEDLSNQEAFIDGLKVIWLSYSKGQKGNHARYVGPKNWNEWSLEAWNAYQAINKTTKSTKVIVRKALTIADLVKLLEVKEDKIKKLIDLVAGEGELEEEDYQYLASQLPKLEKLPEGEQKQIRAFFNKFAVSTVSA